MAEPAIDDALASSHSADVETPPSASAKMTNRRPAMPMTHQNSGRPMSRARSSMSARRTAMSTLSPTAAYLTLKL
ncbi:hypothetical protein GGQ82_004153 [Sphingobium olei]